MSISLLNELHYCQESIKSLHTQESLIKAQICDLQKAVDKHVKELLDCYSILSRQKMTVYSNTSTALGLESYVKDDKFRSLLDDIFDPKLALRKYCFLDYGYFNLYVNAYGKISCQFKNTTDLVSFVCEYDIDLDRTHLNRFYYGALISNALDKSITKDEQKQLFVEYPDGD